MTDLLTLYRQAEEFLIARGKEQLFRNNPDAAAYTPDEIRNCLNFQMRDIVAVAQTMALQQVVEKLR